MGFTCEPPANPFRNNSAKCIILVNVLKRGVDNSAPGSTLFGKCAADPEDNEDLFGYGIHAQLAGCRSNVIQGGTSLLPSLHFGNVANIVEK